QGGEFTDLALVDRRLKTEIELLKRAVKGQMGQARAGTQVALPTGSDLDAQQIDEEVGIGQLTLRRRLQAGIEHLGGRGQPQLLKLLAGLLQADHSRLTSASAAYAAKGRCSTSIWGSWRGMGSGRGRPSPVLSPAHCRGWVRRSPGRLTRAWTASSTSPDQIWISPSAGCTSTCWPGFHGQ